MHRLGRKNGFSQPNFVFFLPSALHAGDSVRTIHQDLYNCTFEKAMPTTRRACRAALFQSIGDDVLTQAGVSCVRTRVNWTQRNERGLEILGIFEECGRLAVAIARDSSVYRRGDDQGEDQ